MAGSEPGSTAKDNHPAIASFNSISGCISLDQKSILSASKSSVILAATILYRKNDTTDFFTQKSPIKIRLKTRINAI
jgi:hypothetical protein|tara:strand:- start:97 stop:327 length:231 start_codon:yes stop_codon:yes gene_type:complete